MAHGGPSYRALLDISDTNRDYSHMNGSSRSNQSSQSITLFHQPSTPQLVVTWPSGVQSSFRTEANSAHVDSAQTSYHRHLGFRQECRVLKETLPSKMSCPTPQALLQGAQTICRGTYTELLQERERHRPLIAQKHARQQQPTAKHLYTIQLRPSHLPQRPTSQTTPVEASRQQPKHPSPSDLLPPKHRKQHQPHESCQHARLDLNCYQDIQTGAARIKPITSSPSATPTRSHHLHSQQPRPATPPYPTPPLIPPHARPPPHPSPFHPQPGSQSQPLPIPPHLRSEIGTTPPAPDLIACLSDRPASYDPVLLAQLPPLHSQPAHTQQAATATAHLAARLDAALSSLSVLSSLACLSALTSLQFPALDPVVVTVTPEGSSQRDEQRQATRRGGDVGVGAQHGEDIGRRNGLPRGLDGKSVMCMEEEQGVSEGATGGGEGCWGGGPRRKICWTWPGTDRDIPDMGPFTADRSRNEVQGQVQAGVQVGRRRRQSHEQDLHDTKVQQHQQEQQQPPPQRQQQSARHVSDPQQARDDDDAVRDQPAGYHRGPNQPPLETQPRGPAGPPPAAGRHWSAGDNSRTAGTPSVLITTSALEGLIADTAAASAASVVEQYHRRHVQQLQQLIRHNQHQNPHQEGHQAVHQTNDGRGVMKGGAHQGAAPAQRQPTEAAGFAFRTSRGGGAPDSFVVGVPGRDGGRGGSGGGFQALLTDQTEGPSAQSTTGDAAGAPMAMDVYQQGADAASDTEYAWHGFEVPSPDFNKTSSNSITNYSTSTSTSSTSSCENRCDDHGVGKEDGTTAPLLHSTDDPTASTATAAQTTRGELPPPPNAIKRVPNASDPAAASSGHGAAAAAADVTDLDVATDIAMLLPPPAAAERTVWQSRWGGPEREGLKETDGKEEEAAAAEVDSWGRNVQRGEGGAGLRKTKMSSRGAATGVSWGESESSLEGGLMSDGWAGGQKEAVGGEYAPDLGCGSRVSSRQENARSTTSSGEGVVTETIEEMGMPKGEEPVGGNDANKRADGGSGSEPALGSVPSEPSELPSSLIPRGTMPPLHQQGPTPTTQEAAGIEQEAAPDETAVQSLDMDSDLSMSGGSTDSHRDDLPHATSSKHRRAVTVLDPDNNSDGEDDGTLATSSGARDGSHIATTGSGSVRAHAESSKPPHAQQLGLVESLDAVSGEHSIGGGCNTISGPKTIEVGEVRSVGSSRKSQEMSVEGEVKDVELESDASGGLIVPLSLGRSDEGDGDDGSGELRLGAQGPLPQDSAAPSLPPAPEELEQERTNDDLDVDSLSDSNSAIEVDEDRVRPLNAFVDELGLEESSHLFSARSQDGLGVHNETSDHSLSYSLSMSNLVIGSDPSQYSRWRSGGSGGRSVMPYGLASSQPYRPLPPPPAAVGL